MSMKGSTTSRRNNHLFWDVYYEDGEYSIRSGSLLQYIDGLELRDRLEFDKSRFRKTRIRVKARRQSP